MLTKNARRVGLPDGEVVEVSDTPLAWWSEANASGYVDPKHIAPDPKNVRKSMSPLKLAELKQSIRDHGVRQSLVLTPRSAAPWARVDKKYENCFFLAVGGHRRRACALDCGLEAVPVQVKIYPNELAHRTDMMVLNKGQEPPTVLEQGYELAELKRLGSSNEKLSRHAVLSVPHVYMRINLTKLEPSLQKLLDEDKSQKGRSILGSTLGGHLGSVATATVEELELLLEGVRTFVTLNDVAYASAKKDLDSLNADERRFLLQHILFTTIRKRNMSGDQGRDFILSRKVKLSSSHSNSQKSTREQPSRRRDLLISLGKGVLGSMVCTWNDDDYLKIFQNVSREDIQVEIDNLKPASESLKGIIERMERIRDTKPATRPEVLALMNKKKK